MISERRKYIRLSTGIGFSYKLKDSREVVKKAHTKNISPGGIRGMVDKVIKKGDLLELNIEVPNLKKPISAIGKVIWTADEKADKIDVGIKFEEIDIGMKNKFLEHICELMFSELERVKV